MAFAHGLLIGLAMIIFIGPVLFTLIQAALAHGYKGGLAVALGIIVSDILALLICRLAPSQWLSDPGHQGWIALAGALILFFLSWRYVYRPQYLQEAPRMLSVLGYSELFGKGFLVNFVNPFVFLIWLGVIGLAQGKYAGQVWQLLIGALLGIFLTDNLKAFYAAKLKRYLSNTRLRYFYRSLALIFLVFAIRLLYFSWKNF